MGIGSRYTPGFSRWRGSCGTLTGVPLLSDGKTSWEQRSREFSHSKLTLTSLPWLLLLF